MEDVHIRWQRVVVGGKKTGKNSRQQSHLRGNFHLLVTGYSGSTGSVMPGCGLAFVQQLSGADAKGCLH